MPDPITLEKAQRTAVFAAMKRARNPEFRAMWEQIYKQLVERSHKVETDEGLDMGEGLCADISARDEFVPKK
jgi:hypothetical protein